MPYSVNGIGTGLIRASRRRNVAGCIQYDAIEAFMIFYLPIIPYSVIHVLSMWGTEAGEAEYQSIKLRHSWRIIAKAFLNRWGNVLVFFAGLSASLSGLAFATMKRPFSSKDAAFLYGSVAVLLVGVVLKICWFLLGRSDERIKDIIGPHELGTSDPYYWTQSAVAETSRQLLSNEPAPSLIDLAERLFARGDRAGTMLCLRLRMQSSCDPRTEALFHSVLGDTQRGIMESKASARPTRRPANTSPAERLSRSDTCQ